MVVDGPLGIACWLGLGALAGAVAQRTHFCTMGGIADALLMGSLHRLRAWAAAIGVAALAAAALGVAGTGPAIPPQPGLVAALLGGGALGFGMVLAGGCLSRNLVRAGTGSLRAVAVLLVIAVAALAVTTGPLAVPARALAAALPLAPVAAGPWPALAIAVAAGAFALTGASRSRARRDLAGGAVLGLVAAAAWLVATPAAPGLNPMLALELGGAALLLADPLPAFAALTVGFVLGAALAAGRHRRVERFAGGTDAARHLAGAVLMGLGGGLVGGCTLGHGLVGVAAAAPASWAVLAGIAGGAAWAVRYLETGGLLSGLFALIPGRAA